MPRRALVAALLVCGLVAGGCGISTTSDTGRFESLLGQVADTDNARTMVTVVDLVAARDEAGVAQPSTDAPSSAFRDYAALFTSRSGVQPVLAIAPAVVGRTATRIDEWRDGAGFSVFDIDASIEAGQPPEVESVVEGRIDPDAVERALRTSDGATVAEREGERVVSIGEDEAIDVDEVSAIRPIGASVRAAVVDGRIRWARTDAALDRSLEAAHGGRSLADDDDFRATAGALDDAHAYQAVLTGRPDQYDLAVLLGRRGRRSSAQVEALIAELRADALRPWSVAAVGDTVVGGKAGGVIVIAHASEETAQQNAGRLRTLLRDGRDPTTNQRYSTLMSNVRVQDDGRLVVATMTLRNPQLLIRQLQQGGSPLAIG